MKRQDALRKLHTVCQRLAEADPAQFPVVALRLYLFGSLLTDKPNPSDVDLLFEYRDRSDLDRDEMLWRMSYGRPLPHDQARTQLRRGMKWIRMELLVNSSVEEWLETCYFLPGVFVPIQVIWEPGLDWRRVVDEIESRPLPWDPDQEKRLKHLHETAKQIAKEQGIEAAKEWLGKQA